MPPAVAVQVIVVIAWVSVTSPTLTGAASFSVFFSTFHPSFTCAPTCANGWSLGSETTSLVVLVLSDSVGTRKISFAYPPGLASGDDTVTWADADEAAPTRTSADAATIAPARRTNLLGMREPFKGVRVTRPKPVSELESLVRREVHAGRRSR